MTWDQPDLLHIHRGQPFRVALPLLFHFESIMSSGRSPLCTPSRQATSSTASGLLSKAGVPTAGVNSDTAAISHNSGGYPWG